MSCWMTLQWAGSSFRLLEGVGGTGWGGVLRNEIKEQEIPNPVGETRPY